MLSWYTLSWEGHFRCRPCLPPFPLLNVVQISGSTSKPTNINLERGRGLALKIIVYVFDKIMLYRKIPIMDMHESKWSFLNPCRNNFMLFPPLAKKTWRLQPILYFTLWSQRIKHFDTSLTQSLTTICKACRFSRIRYCVMVRHWSVILQKS